MEQVNIGIVAIVMAALLIPVGSFSVSYALRNDVDNFTAFFLGMFAIVIGGAFLIWRSFLSL